MESSMWEQHRQQDLRLYSKNKKISPSLSSFPLFLHFYVYWSSIFFLDCPVVHLVSNLPYQHYLSSHYTQYFHPPCPFPHLSSLLSLLPIFLPFLLFYLLPPSSFFTSLSLSFLFFFASLSLIYFFSPLFFPFSLSQSHRSIKLPPAFLFSLLLAWTSTWKSRSWELHVCSGQSSWRFK